MVGMAGTAAEGLPEPMHLQSTLQNCAEIARTATSTSSNESYYDTSDPLTGRQD